MRLLVNFIIPGTSSCFFFCSFTCSWFCSSLADVLTLSSLIQMWRCLMEQMTGRNLCWSHLAALARRRYNFIWRSRKTREKLERRESFLLRSRHVEILSTIQLCCQFEQRLYGHLKCLLTIHPWVATYMLKWVYLGYEFQAIKLPRLCLISHGFVLNCFELMVRFVVCCNGDGRCSLTKAGWIDYSWISSLLVFFVKMFLWF